MNGHELYHQRFVRTSTPPVQYVFREILEMITYHLFLGSFGQFVALTKLDDRVEVDDVLPALSTTSLGVRDDNPPPVALVVTTVFRIGGNDLDLIVSYETQDPSRTIFNK